MLRWSRANWKCPHLMSHSTWPWWLLASQVLASWPMGAPPCQQSVVGDVAQNGRPFGVLRNELRRPNFLAGKWCPPTSRLWNFTQFPFQLLSLKFTSACAPICSDSPRWNSFHPHCSRQPPYRNPRQRSPTSHGSWSFAMWQVLHEIPNEDQIPNLVPNHWPSFDHPFSLSVHPSTSCWFSRSKKTLELQNPKKDTVLTFDLVRNKIAISHKN